MEYEHERRDEKEKYPHTECFPSIVPSWHPTKGHVLNNTINTTGTKYANLPRTFIAGPRLDAFRI